MLAFFLYLCQCLRGSRARSMWAMMCRRDRRACLSRPSVGLLGSSSSLLLPLQPALVLGQRRQGGVQALQGT